MAGVRSALTTWCRAIGWVTRQKNGARAKGLQRLVGLGGSKTAWTGRPKRHRARVRPGRARLAGVVEVDEIARGGEKPGKRGRGAEGKARVLIAAPRDGERRGRIRLRRVRDAAGASWEPAVPEAVEPGSVVRTDGWGGYHTLGQGGYVREIGRQNADVGAKLRPRGNRVAARLKRGLLGTHPGAVSREPLDDYLAEYPVRCNRRTSRYRGKRFYRLMQQAVAIEPVPEAALVKQVRGPKPKKHQI